MKRDSIWAILAGILLTLVVAGLITAFIFPEEFIAIMIAMGVFLVFLWLNAYRVSRKKQGIVYG